MKTNPHEIVSDLLAFGYFLSSALLSDAHPKASMWFCVLGVLCVLNAMSECSKRNRAQ